MLVELSYHDVSSYYMQAGNSFGEGSLPTKLKTKMTFDANDVILVKKKTVPGKDGLKVSPEHDCYL